MIKWRLKDLAEKLLSFKFVMVLITTLLRILGFVGNAEWLTVTTIVITGREISKGINGFTRGKNEEKLGCD